MDDLFQYKGNLFGEWARVLRRHDDMPAKYIYVYKLTFEVVSDCPFCCYVYALNKEDAYDIFFKNNPSVKKEQIINCLMIG